MKPLLRKVAAIVGIGSRSDTRLSPPAPLPGGEGSRSAAPLVLSNVGDSVMRQWLSLLSCLVALWLSAETVRADDASKPKADLGIQQQQIRRDYERFERSLLEAAEHLRRKEPEQADTLDRVREKSQQQALLAEMDKITLELQQKQTGSAADRQKQVIERLKEILQMLQSDDERDRLKRDMEFFQEALKDTNRLIGRQRDVKSDNQKGGDLKKVEADQKKTAEEARKLAQKLDKHNQDQKGDPKSNGKDPKDPSGKEPPKDGDGKPMDGDAKPGEQKLGDKADPKKPGDPKPGEKPKDSKPGEKKPGEPMPGDPKSSDGKPSEGEPSDGKPMPGKPMDGQPMPGKSMPGQKGQPMPGQPMPPPDGQPPQPQEQQPPEPQNDDGRDDLDKAQDSMQKAIEELEKKSREAAGEEQEQALRELEKLKAKLEEILRQRREEEKELYLAMLEVRFQKMLKVQLQINSETTRLDKIPQPERNPAHFDKCNAAAQLQRGNVADADKALSLLKEEGSSVAFPEAVEQMGQSMELIVERLTGTDTGGTTQLLETIVVETLEEIILAMQKELEAQRQKKNQPPKKQQQGSPQDNKLVEQLAELKMIRSLQNQVNRLTKQIGIEIDGEQAADTDHRKLAEDLAKRQQRIQSATYDLSTGRNE